MIGDIRPISLKVSGDGGNATSRQAECLGLIVTELVMNALKHAFSNDKSDGRITVGYDAAGMNWKLSVADNGIGRPDGVFAQPKAGLGTSIVKALAQQLGAQVNRGRRKRNDRVGHSRHVFGEDPSRVKDRQTLAAAAGESQAPNRARRVARTKRREFITLGSNGKSSKTGSSR
jgi:hypothetical protein